jgi:hypothetical protein
MKGERTELTIGFDPRNDDSPLEGIGMPFDVILVSDCLYDRYDSSLMCLPTYILTLWLLGSTIFPFLMKAIKNSSSMDTCIFFAYKRRIDRSGFHSI